MRFFGLFLLVCALGMEMMKIKWKVCVLKTQKQFTSCLNVPYKGTWLVQRKFIITADIWIYASFDATH